jgi:hypothetical protein
MLGLLRVSAVPVRPGALSRRSGSGTAGRVRRLPAAVPVSRSLPGTGTAPPGQRKPMSFLTIHLKKMASVPVSRCICLLCLGVQS